MIDSINNYCFLNCENLQTIEFVKNVQFFGAYVFVGCKTLTRIELLMSVSIPDGCFVNCSSLQEVVLNQNFPYISIGEKAFFNCTSLKTFNYNVIEVPAQAFAFSGLIFNI